MFCDFKTTTHAKWILLGEHAVLRGHGALVFPIHTHKLNLTYFAAPSELNADFTGRNGADMHLLFWSVLQEGHQLLQLSLNRLNGHFHIDSNIPVGVGMGASAALCVAMARWFAAQQLIQLNSIADFARNLENLFHGQSSGLDIAGVASELGIYFNQGKTEPLQQAWQPHWYLSSCEQLGITSHCIQQVQQLWQTNPAEAKNIDNHMAQAVTNARLALENESPGALLQLTNAIHQGEACFQQWGLINDNLAQHIQLLKHAGALAVKPTGSGNGGFVLSLWHAPLTKQQTNTLPFEMVTLS